MKNVLPLFLFLLAAPPAVSQVSVVADDGSIVSAAPTTGGAATNRAPGSLTTHFNGGNGFAGNMFDITPAVDMEITGLDFHARNATGLFDIDVWYRVGSCVGYDMDPSTWTLLAQDTGIQGAGAYMPTFADLSGNGVTFVAGQTYGIYMDNVNYALSGGINYTNGVSTPETYSNSDIVLDAYYGKATPSFTGSTFTPRVWNGTLYYDTGGGPPPGPSLSVANLVAGSVADISIDNATPNNTAYFVYSLAGGGPISTPFGPGYVSAPYKVIPLATDANGHAGISKSVPVGTTGMNIWFHGADRGSATMLNAIAAVIG
ncbi:MAG: hypothetical protein CMJ96_04240 [Planctomycetes bacterium]|jgi:hypothetical protein|nr:hypothetical protein [Planctomycetota bacterium]MDP7246716.1 hypothetical protein [Planctomycetota bacterium]|tara:strand:- start:2692 stop:3639 length:948 start_codon:yes stop_codon:yes gene_type:complete